MFSSLHSKSHPSAFTLVETVLALGVLAFAIVPLLGLMSVGLQTHKAAMDETVAGQIAQKTIASARETSFTELSALQGGTSYFDEQGLPDPELGPADYIYRATTDVKMATGIPEGTGRSLDAGLATVTVNIARISAPGEVIRYSTWISNNGL